MVGDELWRVELLPTGFHICSPRPTLPARREAPATKRQCYLPRTSYSDARQATHHVLRAGLSTGSRIVNQALDQTAKKITWQGRTHALDTNGSNAAHTRADFLACKPLFVAKISLVLTDRLLLDWLPQINGPRTHGQRRGCKIPGHIYFGFQFRAFRHSANFRQGDIPLFIGVNCPFRARGPALVPLRVDCPA
jgi:hypothetical protein